MVTSEQVERIRNLAQLYVEELPDDQALDALVLIYDVCEILTFTADQLAVVFGANALRWVTALVYGAAGKGIDR